MEFSPNNPIIQRCLQALAAAAQDRQQEAGRIFLQAWQEATDDFDRFIVAHLLGRQEQDAPQQLHWLNKALKAAAKTDSISVQTALPSLYRDFARCYEALGNQEKARLNEELASTLKSQLKDEGPFYHGTKADLQNGDLLVAGGRSNYQSDITMNHIYFTALIDGAGLAAALAKGEGPDRVYIIEPTGSFEDDPNVTDKKFPGNPTRSYRSEAPLKILGEITNWQKLTQEEKEEWNKKLANNNGAIIN